MEYKYKNTLENVLILADEEVIEILTQKSYYDTCAPRAQNTYLTREKLSKLLPIRKKHRHFGLNIKEKRLHKKIRHYTMKIVNFKMVLLHDKPWNEDFLVFYRSGLSFNTNMANFYFSGVKTLIKRRTNRKEVKRLKRAIKKCRNLSFKKYLREAIKNQFYKHLDGEYKGISVHAIFTVENPNKSKVFITRDITKFSDIAKFIKTVDDFDWSLNHNLNRKLEERLGRLNIPMNNVLVITQVSPGRKNLLIQWNEKLVKSLRGRNVKPPKRPQLINTSILNLRLEHLSFHEAECTNVKSIVNKMEDLVTKNIQNDNIENKLEKQLNSCKTFMACLDAFEASHMSSGFSTLRSMSTRQAEVKPVGDTGFLSHRDDASMSSDAKVQGILSKINTLQKRIRSIVKTSPSLHKDADIRIYSMQNSDTDSDTFSLSTQINSQSLAREMDVSSTQLDISKRDTFQKSKPHKPEICRKVESNLVKIKEFLKNDVQESKQRLEGILNNEKPKLLEELVAPVNITETSSNIDSNAFETPKEVSLKNKIEQPGAAFEQFLKILKENANSEDLMKIMNHLDEKKADDTKTGKAGSTPPVNTKTNNCTGERAASKTKFATKKLRPKPKAKRPKSKKVEQRQPPKPILSAALESKPSEPSVIKLENFIEQILKITKSYFTNGSRDDLQTVLGNVLAPSASKTGDAQSQAQVITIKKFSEMADSQSEHSTETLNSFVRRVNMVESGIQTERNRKRKVCTKLTQTEVEDLTAERKHVAMETQTDISINKHAQIKFSGMNMQLSKNVTITNVRKNVINVRNICEETSEAVKRLLESDAAFNEEDSPNLKEVVETISEDLRNGNNKEEILGQIKNTLENVIDRFKKSTLLISKASNFSDLVPTELPMAKQLNMVKFCEHAEELSTASAATTTSSTSQKKEDINSNVKMSLKLLKNLSEVTKTIKKNPKEAARKLHGIRNELMHYRTSNLYSGVSSKVSSNLYLPKTSSTLTSSQVKGRVRRSNVLFPRNVPLNMYGYPASNTDIKPDLNELNRIFTPKTRSICNTELSIIKHRDRHADHIASHLNTHPKTSSKNCFNFKKYRSKSAQLKSHKCQMYVAKTYKKSYANTLSATACAPPNVPQIQTAIENPLVPKIVRPVRWKHPLPESPQLSNLSLKDVKPFNSEYPRKDHVSASTHSYLNRLLETQDKQVPTIKCSDSDCSKCFQKSAVSECSHSPTRAAHFKMEKAKSTKLPAVAAAPAPAQPQSQAIVEATPNTPSVTFDFGKFMVDPEGKNTFMPKMNFTVCPVNVMQQNKAADAASKSSPQQISKKLCEVKNNQNKMQKSIQQAIIQNQEKFQVMQRILTLSKPQERKVTNQPSSSLNFSKSSSAPPKIKSTHTKKFSKTNDASTSKSRGFPSNHRSTLSPQQSHSIQTAVATYKTVKQVQPHPKLKQLQQHQIPLKPKSPNANNNNIRKPTKDPNRSATFNAKYSEVSLSSLKTINKEEKQPKTLTQNVKNVKRSQEDIQKYIALVEQKFLKTFSLNEQEKEGAYKNLVDEIQGMLNVLNSKDKIDKKMKIKKSVEKLTKETESATIEAPKQMPVTPSPVKKNAKLPNTEEIVSYTKTLESVEKSLKTFQNDCEENNKISEAATEKLLNWKTTKPAAETAAEIPAESSSKSPSKTSISSKTSMHYTLSEKERIIEEKLEEFPGPSNETAVITIKEPISMAETIESEDAAKKKNSDFSGPTMLSVTSDSLNETTTDLNFSDLSLSSFSKFQSNKAKPNFRSLNKTKTRKATKHVVQETPPNGTETSLLQYSNDNTEDGYITITDFSELNSNSSGSTVEIKITPLVDFSVEMYMCDHLHYSYRCQRPLQSLVPHIYHKIHYTDQIEPKPITQAYKKKYSLSKVNSYDKLSYDYPVSSNLNFNNMLVDDSYSIEHDFIKSYSDKLFTESINTILSKNSDISLRNIFGTGTMKTTTTTTTNTTTSTTTSNDSKRLSQKTSANLYEYIDLLSNISRIFIEPEIAQFYQPKFVSYTSVPERETRTYNLTSIFCRIQFTYADFNPSMCNLLTSESQSNLSQSTQKTVSDVTLTSFESALFNTPDLLPISSCDLSQIHLEEDTFYSVKSSITKFEFFNENVEIQSSQVDNLNVSIQNVDVDIPKTDITDKKLSLEELFVENVCFASKKSSTYFNIDNFDVEINLNKTEETNDEQLIETATTTSAATASSLTNTFKSLSNQLAQQSNELSQLLLKTSNTQHLPKLVSVKNFNAHKYMSYPTLNAFDYAYDCNYDFKLTISPKYLSTNFPSASCMQILPLLKTRIGDMSHSLTMKIELSHSKGSRLSPRNISFKKPKRNIVGFSNINKAGTAAAATHKCEPLITGNKMNLNMLQVQKREMYTESYKMILIFLYVSIFSLIFICMTLNYKCD